MKDYPAPSARLYTGSEGATMISAIRFAAVSKSEVIATLAATAAELGTGLTRDVIVERALQREQIVSSVVGEGIAFPHAVVQGYAQNAIVIGVLDSPVGWGMPGQDVTLVALFVGGDRGHLRAMSLISRVFRHDDLVSEILAMSDGDAILERIIATVHEIQPEEELSVLKPLNHAMLDAAKRLGKAAAAVIVIQGGTFDDTSILLELINDFTGYVLCDRRGAADTESVTWIEGVTLPHGDTRRLKRELLRLIAAGLVGTTENVVFLSGTYHSNRLEALELLRPDTGPGKPILPHIEPVVSTRVLEIAEELGKEGREGKSVGALFVIGNPAEIAPYTHQLIVNPFLGYSEEARNILDPSLEETIKEFSKIDGAFVIAIDGTVVSAGTYLAVSPERLDHHPGEGARHASARAITAVTASISIAVSESTGRISVYVGGHRRI